MVEIVATYATDSGKAPWLKGPLDQNQPRWPKMKPGKAEAYPASANADATVT
jgi:hypothetical protein